MMTIARRMAGGAAADWLARALLAVSLALALPATVAAQQQEDEQASEEENFSPSHLRKAQQIIDLTRSDAGFDEILPLVADQTMALFIRSNPALTAEIEDVTTATAIQMAQRRRELNNILQRIWARRFTEAQLDELIAFFSSDLGRQLTEELPTITALSIGASKQWGDQLSSEMVTEVREELRARGYEL